MLNENKKLENEKEMIKRKVTNFKSTLSKEGKTPKGRTSVVIEKSKSSMNVNKDIERSEKEGKNENSKTAKTVKSDHSSPRKTVYANEFTSKLNEELNVEQAPLTTRNLNITKKYSMESEDELDNNLASIDNNFLNEINSDVEHNVVK